MTCLTNIIGLSRATTDCDAVVPAGLDVTTSKTGVYLDEMPEFPRQKLLDTLKKEYWTRLDTVRKGSINFVTADLKAFLSQRYPKRPAYQGLLGNNSCTQYLPPVNGETRLPLWSRQQRGGSFVISGLGLMLSDNVTNLPVSVYQDEDPTPLKTMNLSTRAQSAVQTALPEPWELPLNGARYHLKATLPEGVRVANNLLNCGCGGNVNTLSSVFENCCTGQASGFILTVSVKCDYDPLICAVVNDDRLRLVVTYMLSYQMLYWLLAKPGSSTKIERTSVLSNSEGNTEAKTCQKEYLNRLNWLKAELPDDLDTHDACYHCPPAYGWNVGGAFR